MKMTLLKLILMLIAVIGVATSVLAQTNSPPGDRSSRQPSVTNTNPAPTPVPKLQNPDAVPDVLKNPLLIGTILAKLEQETARANNAEKTLFDVSASRDEWKRIADKEKNRADSLESANLNRQNEVKELAASRDYLRESVNDYKSELTSTRRDLDRANSAKKYYAAGGAFAGYTACRALDRP